MRILTFIIFIWFSLFTGAQSEDNKIIVNACLGGITDEDIKGHFGTGVSIGELNYCSGENAKPIDGNIFIFGYGHGKWSGGDKEICFGHGCVMGDAKTRTTDYQPNILNGDFPKYYFSLRIKDSANYSLEKFRVHSIPYSNHVGGLYLKAEGINNVKMACFIWSGHKKEEKIRLLSECNERWLERNQPQFWMRIDGNMLKENVRPTS